MRVIAVSTLKAFWTGRPEYQDAEGPTMAWYREAVKADWSTPDDVKRQFGNASILKGRVDKYSLPSALRPLPGHA